MFGKKTLSWFLLVVGLAVLIAGYFIYTLAYKPNVTVDDNKQFVYIKTGSTFEDVLTGLASSGLISDVESFKRLAELKKYDQRIRPGKYRIRKGMNNNALVNMLRAGMQEPVDVPLYGLRTVDQIVERVSSRLEVDADELRSLLNDADFLQPMQGLSPEQSLALFRPVKYSVYWNTSAQAFLEKVKKDFAITWTDERVQKAKDMGLTPAQVTTLASIVEAEQSKYEEEWPVIAGLYLNRLKQDMPLQSDPTLIYAKGDFTISRVRFNDLKIESPYNTYKNKGLPPGPILIPSSKALDAVLNARKHNFVYMVAKSDLSGKHVFTSNFNDHRKFADLYRKALDTNNIQR